VRIVEHDGWPGGVSDGFAGVCAVCAVKPVIDYTVSDLDWLLVPEKYRRDVVCLGCFFEMGGRPRMIERLMVSTPTETLEMEPALLWKWRRPDPLAELVAVSEEAGLYESTAGANPLRDQVPRGRSTDVFPDVNVDPETMPPPLIPEPASPAYNRDELVEAFIEVYDEAARVAALSEPVEFPRPSSLVMARHARLRAGLLATSEPASPAYDRDEAMAAVLDVLEDADSPTELVVLAERIVDSLWERFSHG